MIIENNRQNFKQKKYQTRVHRTYNILEVIACAFCQIGEDNNLLIGAPAKASQVPGLTHCPSCRVRLHHNDIVAVGIDALTQSAQEVRDAA